MSAGRTRPEIWIYSSPRLSVSCFCPRTSIVPLAKTCATVTVISPDSRLDCSASPLPLKSCSPPMFTSLLEKSDNGPVGGALRQHLPDRSVVRAEELREGQEG